MPYPYPQDRNRDRREKGEQPYRDAKQELAETDAQIQNEAEARGEALRAEQDEERANRAEREALERLRAVNQELEAEGQRG